jgi:hypothetical protein
MARPRAGRGRIRAIARRAKGQGLAGGPGRARGGSRGGERLRTRRVGQPLGCPAGLAGLRRIVGQPLGSVLHREDVVDRHGRHAG